MAGRVERRINDKFYFVLDEVGGSSDCDSELTDSENKLSSYVIQKNEQGENDSNLSKSNNSEFKHPAVHLISLHKNGSDNDCVSGKSEGDNEITVIDENQTKSPERDSENVESDMLPEAVDMDIDSDAEVDEQKQEPIIKVTFRDSDIRKRLKSSILKFFSQKFKDCTIVSNSEDGLEIEVYDKGSKDQLDDLLDFNLDTTPGDNNLEIPNYGRSHDFILSNTNVHEKQNMEKNFLGTSCFNCLGNHNLRDCKLEKNFKVINKNRTLFQMKPQKERTQKVSRYHLDENQKFSHIEPGAISKKLRIALALRHDQQPEFIYRMRVLGYPPAWLEEAKVSHSGVAMYDDTGVPVLDEDEDEEEGEILPEGAKDKFDINKIIEFPGFNVPLPKNFRDEAKFYRCPALSEDQSKEKLINLLKPKTVQAYVKKSLTSQKSQDKSDEKRGSSPTIEEMEEKKRQLLMELSNEDSASEPKPSVEEPPLGQTSTKESPSSSELGTVKNLEFGTPILKSVSPFAKLPSREQFSCNIHDVIQFENLPNSTGKYETIRHVISKIRTTTSKNSKKDG